MITIDASFWSSVGVDSSDGNTNGNQYDFYNSILMSNGVTVYNQKEFFKNSPINSIYYDDQLDWYRAIGVFYSEPIYDQYSFMQNVTFNGVDKVGNQKDFFKFILGIRNFTTLQSASSQYYTIPAVSLTGDFVIELEAVLGNTDSFDTFMSSGSTANRYRLTTGGASEIRMDSYTVSFANPLTLDGKLRTIKLTRVGNDFSLYQDEVLIQTVTDVTGGSKTAMFTRVANENNTNYFNGVLANVKITDGTDLIRYYKIDEDLSATSTIIDSGSDGSNGTAVSITSSEKFTLEGCSWVGSTKTIVIAGCTP